MSRPSFTSHMLVILLAFTISGTVHAVDHSIWDSILKDSVKNGVVDYGKIKERYSELQKYLQSLETISLDTLEPNEKMALFINAYNAQCIRGVLDRGDIESVRDVTFFFKRTQFVLGGKDLSLDSLEHTELRPMGDPRIHFAIVCSSKSCPPLRGEAYQAESLDETLDDQASIFLNSEEMNRLDREKKTFYLSKIFKWFAEDFTKDHESVLDFSKGYLPEDSNDFLDRHSGKIRVEFLPYDWSLNGHY